MYIKKSDFQYLEGLYKGIDDNGKKKFLHALMKSYKIKPDEFKEKIKIVDDDVFDIEGIEPGKFITKTAIKKAYKAIKGELK
ncbi:hypothetical protein JZK55_15280 [Dissulfurispira thermophila]|uniref:Uncharacterized protein n=2 Tax=root TaxID=1 RepID=A0A7G1H3T3_9BACT|nr:hypothetical protein [Dissulfurispira thermophila]BCB96606.1 hypothetical protein JZK55_15280 [Dissulfurispira thermophila]